MKEQGGFFMPIQLQYAIVLGLKIKLHGSILGCSENEKLHILEIPNYLFSFLKTIQLLRKIVCQNVSCSAYCCNNRKLYYLYL